MFWYFGRDVSLLLGIHYRSVVIFIVCLLWLPGWFVLIVPPAIRVRSPSLLSSKIRPQELLPSLFPAA